MNVLCVVRPAALSPHSPPRSGRAKLVFSRILFAAENIDRLGDLSARRWRWTLQLIVSGTGRRGVFVTLDPGLVIFRSCLSPMQHFTVCRTKYICHVIDVFFLRRDTFVT